MTESCSCITAHPLEKSTYKYAHCGGTIVANTEVKIINPDTGVALGYNNPGEILARGPQIVMGYLNNEKATRETFDSDGWLHTGDVGFIDHEGFITITDRIKEMIKVKGMSVFPAEVETAVAAHPAVEACAVVATPDDATGERPVAFVTVTEAVDADSLREFAAERLASYKVPEIRVIEAMPMTATGKIRKNELGAQG